MNIGIEYHTKLIYEATCRHGYPVWPSPILFQVIIASEDDELFSASKANDLGPNSLLFREETYDSTSRIRRGRMYQAGNSQPAQWHVYPHPALANEMQSSDGQGGTLTKLVYEFSSVRLRPYLLRNNLHRPIFIMGSESGFTIWSLVNVETSATGDELVVLRARKSIGALPHLDREKIKGANGQAVLDLVEKLEEELFRAGPESVVDRSREAATAILSTYLESLGRSAAGRDLAKLADMIAGEKLLIVENAAKIIARLHPRGKHAEQERRPIRPLAEQDAEFAVQAVGTILCDLGWAAW